MGRLRAAWRWVVVFVVAGFSILVAALTYGRRKMGEGVSVGEAKQAAKDDREDLRRAEETGDDEGVLREWRKQR